MKRSHVGTGLLLVTLVFVSDAHANLGGRSATPLGGVAATGSVGAVGGFGGIAGMCGPAGFAGASGCYGSGLIGMCGFSGCYGGPYCFGTMSGCLGGIGYLPTQTYSKWAPSPSKAYYHRTLTIQTPPPSDTTLEFVLVHYPSRPKFFYFFDTVEKTYVGRYRIGATPAEAFQLLHPAERKAALKDIKVTAFRSIGGMPTIPQIAKLRTTTPPDAYLQTLKLMRPPESIPDDLLGLPAEEPSLKKPAEKK